MSDKVLTAINYTRGPRSIIEAISRSRAAEEHRAEIIATLTAERDQSGKLVLRAPAATCSCRICFDVDYLRIGDGEFRVRFRLRYSGGAPSRPFYNAKFQLAVRGVR